MESPIDALYEQYKDKTKEEKEELVNELKDRYLKQMRKKLPFGTFVPHLKDVIKLGIKLKVYKVTKKPPICAADYI